MSIAPTTGKDSKELSNMISPTWSSATGDIGGKYGIGSAFYPDDVTVNEELKHIMVFYINVRSNSNYSATNTTVGQVRSDTIKEGAIIGAAGAAATIGVAAATVSAGFRSISTPGQTRRLAGTGGSLAKNVAQTFAKGAAGVVVGKTMSAGVATALTAFGVDVFGSQSTMHRLTSTITLAIQEPPSVTYGANYEEWDAGSMLGGFNAAGFSAMGGVTKAEIIKALQIPGAIGAPDFGRAAQKMAGKSINPFKTALFQDVSLRRFSFNYKFMPKNKREADNVQQIINLFKFHMHPEFSTDKVFLIHPSEFNIAYYYKGNENNKLHKISTCVLTNMHVDYGNGDQMSSFVDGSSVEINIKLDFMETEVMTKERIKEGY